MAEDREEGAHQEPGAHRAALGEHDQAAEERPDEVEGEADGEAGRLGALPEGGEHGEREQEPEEAREVARVLAARRARL
jgi:hypothetical protein